MENAVAINGITKSFGDKKVLDNISIEIKRVIFPTFSICSQSGSYLLSVKRIVLSIYLFGALAIAAGKSDSVSP